MAEAMLVRILSQSYVVSALGARRHATAAQADMDVILHVGMLPVQSGEVAGSCRRIRHWRDIDTRQERPPNILCLGMLNIFE